MSIKILKILSVGFISVIVLLINDYEQLGKFYFYTLAIWGTLEVLAKRKIELIHIWNVAFCFIILSEVFSDLFTFNAQRLDALKYLIIANNFIFLGYISKLHTKSNRSFKIGNRHKATKLTPIALVLCTLLFIRFKIDSALQAITGGRIGSNSEGEETFIIASIIDSLGFLLPALIAYYILILKNKSIGFATLLASPVFIIQFLIGTRFPLLFSVLGFFIVVLSKYPVQKVTFKKVIILVLAMSLLLFGSEAMKSFRSEGFGNTKEVVIINTQESIIPHETILNFGSPEGVLDMTSLMFKHFKYNPHLYGQSSSFLLYFYVPRSLWENKPTMLGYWFIRKYRSGFSSGHSASFGFTGDLYADFGLFSLIPVFFIGRILKFGEVFKTEALQSRSYQTVLGAMIFPYTFFFVRSPITSTISFLGVLFFYFLFKKLFLKTL